MRLSQLEYFIKIAQCGSITKAAQELFLSQPSLTKAINNLETEYNLQLLERTGQRHPRDTARTGISGIRPSGSGGL